MVENFAEIQRQEEIDSMPELNWDDLVFLSTQSWGLRHISSYQKRIEESSNGFLGDAITLSTPQTLIEANDLPAELDAMRSSLTMSHISGLVDTDTKQRVLTQYQLGVLSFLLDSIGMDINTQFPANATNQETADNILQHTSFILTNIKSANYPYDINNYYGLGKCGKQKVPASDIIAIFPNQNGTEHELPISAPTEPVDQTTFHELKDIYAKRVWTELCQHIQLARHHITTPGQPFQTRPRPL